MDPILWWTAFGAISQCLAAIATFAAVIITLWQVRKANDKILKLSFTDNSELLLESGAERRLVCLTISNVGNRNVVIQNWGIIISRSLVGTVIPDICDPMLLPIQVPLPYKLEPDQTINQVLDLDVFIKKLKEDVDKGLIKKKNKLKLFVTDATGKRYTLNSNKTIEKYISDDKEYIGA